MDSSLGRAVLTMETDLSKWSAGIDNADGKTKKFKNSVKDTDGAIDDLGKKIKQAFTVAAIVAAGQKVIDYADQITNLAARTEIGTEALQGFELAFAPFGVTLDQVATASDKLSKSLVGGDKSAVAALGKLHLNVKDLLALSPEQRFTQVADAIGSIQNPAEKAYAAVTLFGRGGVEMLGGLNGKLGETVKGFQDTGAVISDDALQAIDTFGDQIGVMGKQLLAVTASALLPLVPILTEFGNILVWVAQNVIGPVFVVAIAGMKIAINSLLSRITALMATLAGLASKLPGGVGRQFGEYADYLRTLSKAFSDVAAETASEAFTKKIEAPKKAATETGKALLGLGGDLDKANKKLEAHAAALREIAAAGTSYQEVLDSVDGQIIEAIKYYTALNVSSKALAITYGLTVEKVDALKGALKLQADAMKRTEDDFDRFRDRTQDVAQEVRELADRFGWVEVQTRSLITPLEAIGYLIGNAPESLEKTINAWSDFGDELKQVAASIPLTFQRAFEGGGGIIGAFKSVATQIGSLLYKTLVESISNAAAMGQRILTGKNLLAGGLMAGLAGVGVAASGGGVGAAIGTSVSAGIGVMTASIAAATTVNAAAIGTAVAFGAATMGIGLAAVGAYYGLKKLFGASEESKINPLRQSFIDTAGGLQALNERLDKAAGFTGQMALQTLLAAKNQEQYNAAIQRIDELLSFQDQAFATLDETVKRYGFTLEELGPALQRQNLDKQAAQLYQDFNVLVAAGIDVNTVIRRMGDSIAAFYRDAVKTGQEVPRQMEPILQRMIELGQLTDENGNKITDLKDIKFADTMSEGFAKVVLSVERLIEVIARGLGVSLDDIAAKAGAAGAAIAHMPAPGTGGPPGAAGWEPGQRQSTFEDMPPGYYDVPAPTPMAAGGYGTVSKPTLFLAGEAGKEQYAFSGANKTLATPTSFSAVFELDGRAFGRAMLTYVDSTLRQRVKLQPA